MAENLDRDQALQTVVEPSSDPIADRSLSAPILIVNDQLTAVSGPFQDDRAQISAIKYKYDQTESASEKKSYQNEIDGIAAEKKKVANYPNEEGTAKSDLSLNFAELQQKFNEVS